MFPNPPGQPLFASLGTGMPPAPESMILVQSSRRGVFVLLLQTWNPASGW
ncbi:MAG: hypothetical protein ACYC9Y_10950 [Candidatus Methylomirabilia bacterium]